MSDIADTDLGAATSAYHDFAELIGGSDTTESAEAELLRASNHTAAGRFDVFALEGVADVEDGEIVGSKLLRVEEDANLACLAAVEFDTADAIDSLNGAADLLVSNFGQLAAADRAADEQRQDWIRLRILLGDDRRQRVARKAIYRGRYFFADILSGAVDITFEDEGAGDVGIALAGIDGDFIDAAYARDGVFERENNAGDDFFGSGAGLLNVYVDRGGIGFGKKIYGEAAIRKRAQRHEKSDKHHRENWILYACFG